MGSGCKCTGSGTSLLTVDDISLELQNCYVATLCYWKRFGLFSCDSYMYINYSVSPGRTN